MANATTQHNALEIGQTLDRELSIQIKRVNDWCYKVYRHGEYLASGYDMDEASYIADRIEYDVRFGASYFDSEPVRAKQYRNSMRRIDNDAEFYAHCNKHKRLVENARKGQF